MLLDAPVAMGCLLTERLIGVVEANQEEESGEAERNDRLLGVAIHARTHGHVRHFDELRPGFLDEIEAFFAHDNARSGRRFTPLRRSGPERARALVADGERASKAGA